MQFYVDLVRSSGQPGAPSSGFSECLTALSQGNAAMWYDATVAAGSLEDPATSTVAGKIGYAPAPVVETENAGWLWAWSLAIPETSQNKDAAWTFMEWATSKDYMQLVGNELGWARVPPGSRLSTYEIPEYQEAAAAFADVTLQSIEGVNPEQPGVYPQPWVGVQYVTIPEFQDLGTKSLAGDLCGDRRSTDSGRSLGEGADLRRGDRGGGRLQGVARDITARPVREPRRVPAPAVAGSLTRQRPRHACR